VTLDHSVQVRILVPQPFFTAGGGEKWRSRRRSPRAAESRREERGESRTGSKITGVSCGLLSTLSFLP